MFTVQYTDVITYVSNSLPFNTQAKKKASTIGNNESANKKTNQKKKRLVNSSISILTRYDHTTKIWIQT